MDRVAISKRVRFEVFKRDSFACQYCGQRAPEVILNVDHVKPVAEGGTNDILNLITACATCNAGKGRYELADDAALSKQLNQMSVLNERRQQIEMMAEWRAELEKLDDTIYSMAEDAWLKAIEYSADLTESGQADLKKWTKLHGLEAVYAGISASSTSYLQREENRITIDSINHAFSMIPRVISVQKRSKDKPYLQRLFYARGILRNRLSYLNERSVMSLMEDAVSCGADPEKIIELCKEVRSWTQFRESIDEFIERQRQANDEPSE